MTAKIFKLTSQNQESFMLYSINFNYSLMIKFNSSSNQGKSTDTSCKHLTPIHRLGPQKTVTPFVCQDQTVSPIDKRLDSSPLQIPLALAIKHFVIGEGEKRLSRPKTSTNTSRETTVRLFREDSSEIKSVLNEEKLTNIKNILQQFMESLYYGLEKDLEARFSTEMRRIIIKFRETERAMNQLRTKLINHPDIVEIESKMKEYEKRYQTEMKNLEQTVDMLNQELRRKNQVQQDRQREIAKLREDNIKMEQMISRYERVLIDKLMLQKQQQSVKVNEHLSNIHQMMNYRRFKNDPSSGTMSILPEKYHCLSRLNSKQNSLENSVLSVTQTNINSLRPSSSPLKRRSTTPWHIFKNEQKPTSFCELLKRQRSS